MGASRYEEWKQKADPYCLLLRAVRKEFGLGLKEAADGMGIADTTLYAQETLSGYLGDDAQLAAVRFLLDEFRRRGISVAVEGTGLREHYRALAKALAEARLAEAYRFAATLERGEADLSDFLVELAMTERLFSRKVAMRVRAQIEAKRAAQGGEASS